MKHVINSQVNIHFEIKGIEQVDHLNLAYELKKNNRNN